MVTVDEYEVHATIRYDRGCIAATHHEGMHALLTARQSDVVQECAKHVVTSCDFLMPGDVLASFPCVDTIEFAAVD
jgi:hypothetical protein